MPLARRETTSQESSPADPRRSFFSLPPKNENQARFSRFYNTRVVQPLYYYNYYVTLRVRAETRLTSRVVRNRAACVSAKKDEKHKVRFSKLTRARLSRYLYKHTHAYRRSGAFGASAKCLRARPWYMKVTSAAGAYSHSDMHAHTYVRTRSFVRFPFVRISSRAVWRSVSRAGSEIRLQRSVKTL